MPVYMPLAERAKPVGKTRKGFQEMMYKWCKQIAWTFHLYSLSLFSFSYYMNYCESISDNNINILRGRVSDQQGMNAGTFR